MATTGERLGARASASTWTAPSRAPGHALRRLSSASAGRRGRHPVALRRRDHARQRCCTRLARRRCSTASSTELLNAPSPPRYRQAGSTYYLTAWADIIVRISCCANAAKPSRYRSPAALSKETTAGDEPLWPVSTRNKRESIDNQRPQPQHAPAFWASTAAQPVRLSRLPGRRAPQTLLVVFRSRLRCSPSSAGQGYGRSTTSDHRSAFPTRRGVSTALRSSPSRRERSRIGAVEPRRRVTTPACLLATITGEARTSPAR